MNINLYIYQVNYMKTRFNPILFLVVLLSWSCGTHIPISKMKPENNQTYEVEYLFEHEGCKVYRFRDDGRFVYFTNCTGNTSVMKNDSTEGQIMNVITGK